MNLEYEKKIEAWEKEIEDKKRRLAHALTYNYYSRDSYVYLYESDPLDHYEKWFPLYAYATNINKMLFERIFNHNGESFEQYMIHMDRLLTDGLIYFGDRFKGDIRGECFFYTFSSLNNEYEFKDWGKTKLNSPLGELIICKKCDNNGTMLAFSYCPFLNENIPHDFNPGSWKLVNAFLTQFHSRYNDI